MAAIIRPRLNGLAWSLKQLSRSEKVRYAGLVLLRVALNLIDVAAISLLGALGAALTASASGRPSLEIFGLNFDVQDGSWFLAISGIAAALFVAKSVFAAWLLRATALLISSIEVRLSGEIYSHLFSSDLRQISELSRGNLHWLTGGSVQQSTSGLLSSMANVVAEGTLLVAIFSVFLLVDAFTALAVTAYFLLILAVFQLLISPRLKRLGENIARYSVQIANEITDSTAASREIRVFGALGSFISRFKLARSQLAKSASYQAFYLSLPRYFVESALVIGVLLLVSQQLTVSDTSAAAVTTVVFIAGGMKMMAALLPLQNAISALRICLPQAADSQKLVENLRRAAGRQISEFGRTKPLTSGETSDLLRGLPVSVHEVNFSYRDSTEPTLQNISMEIPAGGHYALVGPSGAGKTTLVDLILGLDEPDSGSIQIGGLAPKDWLLGRPGTLSYVPQVPGIVSGSVAQNVALGIPPEEIDYDRVWTCLALAQAEDFVRQMPKSLDSDFGAAKEALSGGQRQRIGLARALYRRPRFLIMDEATSGLDAGTEAGVTEAVREIGEEITVLVVAHRLTTVQKADCVYLMDKGEIMSSGTFKAVVRDEPLMRKYVELMTFD